MGFRNLSNSKRAVTRLEDVNGLKVRVMANPVALESLEDDRRQCGPDGLCRGVPGTGS